MTLTKSPFGIIDGKQVDLYTIDFNSKIRATITNFGGIITSLFLPDKHGKMGNVVLGYDDLKSYIDDQAYLGAIVGRYCNRIAGGNFSLAGKEFNLVCNDGKNHLHGGTEGFNKKVWHVINTHDTADRVEITLQYDSTAGEEGYPSNLKTTVSYIFTPEDWQIDYKATTDETTILNLTQHTYFNLSGDSDADILDHELQLNTSTFLPIDQNLIPLGTLQEVKGSSFDFTTAKRIDRDLDNDEEQLHFGNGYDHCWVLQTGLNNVASVLFHADSGRKLEVFTNQPGIQLYTGNFLEGVPGRNGETLKSRSALCLETQHFPDSPNQSHFPSAVLSPGEIFHSTTIYKFGIK